jgi:hypothetical protein
MTRTIWVLAGALVLGGCATQYQSAGLTGGHRDGHGPGKLEMVQFMGNGYITQELTQKYALYRSAEVARAKGKPYFVLYDSLRSAARGIPDTIPQVGQIQGKPTATAFLLLLDAPRPGARDTQATLDELRDVVATGELPKT